MLLLHLKQLFKDLNSSFNFALLEMYSISELIPVNTENTYLHPSVQSCSKFRSGLYFLGHLYAEFNHSAWDDRITIKVFF